jgi:hypothetical protein
MTDEKIDPVAVFAQFNSFVADWGARTSEFINHLILVDGGILSITIGAFLNSKVLKFDPIGIQAIRLGWLLLSSSLILALITAFLRITAQRVLISKWKWVLASKETPGLVVIEGNHLFRVVLWLIQGLAFLSCIGGILAISYGASQLLRQSP